MFRTKRTSAPPPVETTTPPARKGSLFRRNRDPVSTSPVRDNDMPRSGRGTGLFGTRRRSSSASDDRRSAGSTGLFGHQNDPVIGDARAKVSEAEAMERAADQALIAARQAVVEARQHVKDLVSNAEREARAAKLRHTEAKGVAKHAGHLGKFN